MTADDVPTNPSVLDTTVLSNFTYIEQVRLLAGLSGICTVPVVREELHSGADEHPYLQPALDSLVRLRHAPSQTHTTVDY
jgi:hypothetical protein